jgi:hypothetical protein
LKTPPYQKTPQKLSNQMGCDGGINLHDAPNRINDNQSSDMLNMWFQDGALRLRPGLVATVQQQYGKILDCYPKNGTQILLKRITVNGAVTQELYGHYIVTQHAILTFDGQNFWKVPNGFVYNSNTNAWDSAYNTYNFTNCVLLPAGQSEYEIAQQSGNMAAIGSVVYMFGSDCFFALGPYIIHDILDDSKVTLEIMINYREPYVPTLMKDCVPAGNGTPFEARNFLTPQVKQQFTTDNANKVYRLCDNALDSETVMIDYDSIQGGQATFILYASQQSTTQNGITVTLDRNNGIISFSQTLVNAHDFGVKSNLTVTYTKTVYQDIPISSCTVGQWFGDRQGQTGGTRLFLSGNPKSPANIYYSAADDASYFAENAWLTAGDPTEPVTAVERYLDILVILKSSSTYSIGVQSGSSVNLSLKSVNSNIGCDIPKSVAVIGDLLVWASTADGVYALSSTQIKDERDVQIISGNINKIMSAVPKEVLQQAVAIKTNSHYMLFAGDNGFVWDYAHLPFSKSSDKNKAVKNLIWVVWKMMEPLDFIFLQGDRVSAVNEQGNVFVLDSTATQDNGISFDAYWFTKAQDFGKPFHKKLVKRCYAGLVNKEAVQLEALVTGPNGQETEEQPIFLRGGSTENQTEILLAGSADWAYSKRYGLRRIASETAAFGVTGFEIDAILNSQP